MAKKAAKKTARRGPPSDYSDASGGGKALAKAIGDGAQAHAALELGITPAFFNHLVRGRKKPGLDLAIKIRDRFGIAVDAW